MSGAWAAKCNFISALEKGDAQTIVCYGTSLTQSGSWVQGLSDALNARWPNKATVINSGMSGKNSSEGLLKVEEKVLLKNPDVVFIEFSMNDAADSLNSGKTAEEVLALAESNLKGIISAIKTSNPSCEIILQTMNPYVKAPNSSLSNRTGLENHVAMYRRVAEEGGYLLIDNWLSWQKILEKDEAEYLNLVPDGVHPNEIGSWKVTLRNLYEMLELADGWIVSENTTLTADTIVDALTVADGVTLDLNGYKLYCTSLAGSGTITSPGTDLTSPDTDGTHVTWSTNGGTAQNAQGGKGANLFNNTSPSTDLDCRNNDKRIIVRKENLPLAVTYDFGEGNSRKVDKYKIYFARPNHESTNDWSRGPKTWTFEGSNDGETWKELDTVGAEDGVSWLTKNCSPKEFSFSNDTAYRFYRITFTASSDATYLELHQLEYFNTDIGELHVNVPVGEETTVGSFRFSGMMKVVKEGVGTLSGITKLGEDAGSAVGMIVAGGKVAVGAATLTVGNNGYGMLTINGGVVETIGDNNVNLAQNIGSSGTVNLNGGTLKTRRVVRVNGASGVLNFNGGTLQANKTTTLGGGLIASSVTTTVNENGGTIDSGNLAVTVGASIHGEGAMRFKGGSSVTLSGANTYAGGTIIELGTKIITSVETAKDTVLGKLIIDGKTKTADENGIVVFEYSGLADEDVPTPVYKNCGDGTRIYRDGDTIKVDFKAPAWEITADTTWNELVKTHGVPAEDATVIINAASACRLTIDTDATVGELVFTGAGKVTLAVNSGFTLAKTGSGAALWSLDNASAGTISVNAGTLKVKSVSGTGTAQTIRVKGGATYDVNGVGDVTVNVILEEGATIANTGTSSVVSGTKQMASLTLEGNATANVHRSFGLVGKAFAATSLNLGAYTLTVTGGNNSSKTYSLFLVNTAVSGTGKILVSDGILCSLEDPSGENFTVEIGSSGQLQLKRVNSYRPYSQFTVGNFVNNGTDGSADGAKSLIVKGTLTPGNAIKKLTLADGAIIKASATQAQTVSTTFSASGTVTIDASEIDKQTLKSAGKNGIDVLTVPAAFNPSSVEWNVANPVVNGVRAKWRVNEDGTKTLYIARNDAFRVIIR